MSYRADLVRIVRTVVEPDAAEIDQHSRFPRTAVKAFGAKGILGMTVSRGAGGGGQGLREASRVVELVARFCGGTATVLRSHFAAIAVLDRFGDRALRAEIGRGEHLSTLALFDRGYLLSASGTARRRGVVVDLHDRKSWVISAGEADSYVWSTGSNRTTLWLVPGNAPGLLVPACHAGIGLRGNAATSVLADPARIPADSMLGAEGEGLDAVLHQALPWFLVLGSAVSLGLMAGTAAAAAAYVGGDQRTRADLARMRLTADSVRVLHDDALAASTWSPDRATRKLFQLTVASAEAAVAVTDLAMKVCGDAAFRRDLGIERRFRDARAASAIEPTVETVLDSA